MAEKALEQLREAATKAADKNGMCEVVAQIDGVRDNGHKYAKGDGFHMHRDLVPAHARAGQVELKQQGSPADKQARPTATK